VSAKLPDDTQSLLLIGKNGSGKTRAAVWHLSSKDLGTTPGKASWVIVNHKREEFINSIPGAVFMKIGEYPNITKKPGIYIYEPRPGVHDEAVTALLWWAYEHENVGVYIDEGYMINPRDDAMNSLYTQGRSKHIPMITLSQRPSRISRLAVSEAMFVQVFRLTDRRDWKTIQEIMPIKLDPYMRAMNGQERLLPDYHSLYYDTREDEPVIATPVPSDEEILEIFRRKLAPNSPTVTGTGNNSVIPVEKFARL
jgi:hypothetical protein